jgi:uncharacterized protein (TIGR02145 family)
MNKILLKTAAAVNIAAAAIIYMACSGDDGKDGKPGAPCTINQVAGVGAIVTCGETSVTIKDGEAGSGGGANGCYLQQTATTGTFNVICGADNVGTVGGAGAGGGCTVATTQGDAYFNFTCPGNVTYRLAKAICNYTGTTGSTSKPYDPDIQMCITTGASQGVFSGCDGEPIDLPKEFCRKKTAADAARSIFTRCGVAYLKDADGNILKDDDGKEVVDPTKNGEYNPETQFCKIYGTLPGAEVTKNPSFLAGDVTNLCGTARYTAGDFCSESKIYRLCTPTTQPITTGVYNPTTQFCQTETGAPQVALTGYPVGQKSDGISGAPVLDVSAEQGAVKILCGTGNLGSLGRGSYGPDKFCYPAAGGASAATYIKCLNFQAGVVSTDGYNENGTKNVTGEYTPTNQYCEIYVTTKCSGTSDCTKNADGKLTDAGIEYKGTVIAVSAGGTQCSAHNPTLSDCINNQVITRCGAPANTDYTATQFCDEREVILPNQYESINAVASSGTGLVKSIGGKLYGFKAFSSGTWMTQNLTYHPGVVPASAGTYDWATATEACPAGWHLPTVAEWDALIAISTANPARELRSITTGNGWGGVGLPTEGNGFNAVARNIYVTSSGTLVQGTVVPGTSGTTAVALPNNYAFWWTANEDPDSDVGGNKNNSFFKYFFDTDVVVKQGSGVKLANGLNVRCVKN